MIHSQVSYLVRIRETHPEIPQVLRVELISLPHVFLAYFFLLTLGERRLLMHALAELLSPLLLSSITD